MSLVMFQTVLDLKAIINMLASKSKKIRTSKTRLFERCERHGASKGRKATAKVGRKAKARAAKGTKVRTKARARVRAREKGPRRARTNGAGRDLTPGNLRVFESLRWGRRTG
jgi:hypothetical protein